MIEMMAPTPKDVIHGLACGRLIKLILHDGLGMPLYCKRLSSRWRDHTLKTMPQRARGKPQDPDLSRAGACRRRWQR